MVTNYRYVTTGRIGTQAVPQQTTTTQCIYNNRDQTSSTASFDTSFLPSSTQTSTKRQSQTIDSEKTSLLYLSQNASTENNACSFHTLVQIHLKS